MSYLDFDFPHTKFFESDLRELIKQVFIMNDLVTNFVSINAIKYADPIQWNITKSYEKNTVVIDGNSGVAYISVRPVPAGVSLTREQYWTKVFDLSVFITKGAANFANTYEAEPTTTATQETQEGNWVVWDATLYKALGNIHPGDRYVPGGNIRKMTVEDFYNILKSIIDNEIHEREAGDDALEIALNEETELRVEGDSALHTEIVNESVDRENADIALQNNIDAEVAARENADDTIQSEIGILANLNTADKSNLVNAINELYNVTTIYALKSDLISDTNEHNLNDIVYVQESDSYYKIVNTSSPITLTLTSKYAELLPDTNGFYHVRAVTTTVKPDVYDIINYLFGLDHTFIYLDAGEYALSDTLTVSVADTPQIKLIGAGKYNTVIDCAHGFIDVTIDGYNFRGSEFIGFSAKGVPTGIVGGDYHGCNFVSANDNPNDMFDNVKFKDVLLQHFNVAVRIVCRSIWNLWTDCDFIYNQTGFVFSKTSTDSFFNCNTFINCRISSNRARGVLIYGKTGQAVSNNFIGCSIEGNYYTNEISSGNIVELDVMGAGITLTGCHFEKINTLANATALCAVSSNILLNECFFYNYPNHVYTNVSSMLVFNSSSLYGGTALINYGTDTGTTIKNNTFTF